LFDFWRRRDMRLRSRVLGSLDDLPAVVSTSAYRGVQEALTNAAKHARGAEVRVELVVHEDRLSVVVVNDASGRGDRLGEPVGLGWGLEALAERMHLLDGTVEAGPTPEGGWRVRMEIPLPPGEDTAPRRR
jgi:signal transduction histidine kinase